MYIALGEGRGGGLGLFASRAGLIQQIQRRYPRLALHFEGGGLFGGALRGGGLQRVAALLQTHQQAIDGADQRANFILPCEGQNLDRLIGVFQRSQSAYSGAQRSELVLHHPPGQDARQQGEQ